MSPNAADVQNGLKESRHNPGAIRKRLPARLSGERQRTVVCAFRNPDATPPEVAATAGTSTDHLFGGLAAVAEERHPLVDDQSETEEALLDVLANDGLEPDDVLADENRLQTLASAVSRLSGSAVNPDYIEGLVSRDGAAAKADAARIDRIVTARKNTATGLADLADEIGLRRVIEALGESPPTENLDRIMAAQTRDAESDDEPPITIDYIEAQDHWTHEDLTKDVAYSAKVNNKEHYGIFVTLAGRGRDDISGLIHQKKLPVMLTVDDFTFGDRVLVRLDKRKPRAGGDVDLAFDILGVLSASNIEAQEFPGKIKQGDIEEGGALADAAGVDEEELIREAVAAQAQSENGETAADGEGAAAEGEDLSDAVFGESEAEADADEPDAEPVDDAEADETADSVGFEPDTNYHEVLYALGEKAPEADDALAANQLRDHFEGIISYGSISSTTTTLHSRGLLARKNIYGDSQAGDARYAYYISEEGAAAIDAIGPPARVAEGGDEADEADDTGTDEEAPPEPEPEPPMADDTDTDTDDAEPTTTTTATAANADFAGDVMMMAGMAVGRGEVSAEEAAASLRQVAERLERGGPSTWA